MALALARSRTRHLTTTTTYLYSRLLHHPSVSHTVRSIPTTPTVRSFQSTPTVRSNSPAFRPLSPHLPVYRPQLSSTTSILNRMSACVLTGVVLGFYLVYMNAGSICLSFNQFYRFLFYSSKLNLVILELTALAMAYHVYAGIGHLAADFGKPKAAAFLLALAFFIAIGNYLPMEGLQAALLPDSGAKKDGEAKLAVNIESSKTT
ncbi:Sdh_cyt domain-containing protein [Cephalotus follicularis]|uniref:Sdh_cyt domain-containing protein n=1 Tax=Cephalotus follicularis TaxID=3775 RepID=A0A1Q3BNQ4_CEPFO|nr:Sdh_cyt domain-containing protein [Cephalotus follicularis]